MKRLLLSLLLVLVVAGGLVVRQRVVDEVDLFAVQSGSMGTAAPIGSVVATKPDRIDVGDVITYDLQNGQQITHRVIAIADDGLMTTKGDTNLHPDPWVVDERVVRGVVQDVYEQGGYVLRYVTLPAGIASIFAAMVTVWAAWRLFFPKDRLALVPA